MEHVVYLALGANVGDTLANMRAAVRLLRESGCRVEVVSSMYLTKPVGVTDQPDFLNAVIGVRTALGPLDVLRVCESIEETLGRRRTIRWGPRVIDIDILLYEGVAVDEDDLVIPHPRMLERAFVLIPLAEIAPDVEVAEGVTAREAAERIGKAGVTLARDSSWVDAIA